jgi:hypothetical protein
MTKVVLMNIFAQASGAFLVWFVGWLSSDPAPAWAMTLGALVVVGSVDWSKV